MLKVHAALFLVSLFYAILFSFAGQIMPKYLDPGLFVWMRVTVAAAMFFLIAKIRKNKSKIDWKKDGKEIALCAFLGTSGNMLLFFYGLRYTLPINGAVLMLCTPIIVAIIEHTKYRISPKAFQIIGLALASICSFFLISSKGISIAKGDIFGDILVAINAAFYAFYLVRVKPLLFKYSPNKLNSATFGISILYVLPFAIWPAFHTDFSVIPMDVWAKIAYILVVTTFIVYQLNSYAVKHSTPQLAAVYIYLQPVMAGTIALLLGREPFSINKVILCILIILGVWLVNKFKPKFTLSNQ